MSLTDYGEHPTAVSPAAKLHSGVHVRALPAVAEHAKVYPVDQMRPGE